MPTEAIANAHYKRDLKTAAGVGNVDTVKQLTWANLKFQDHDSGNMIPED